MPSAYSRPRSPVWWIKFRRPDGTVRRIASHVPLDADKDAAVALAHGIEHAWTTVTQGTARRAEIADALSILAEWDPPPAPPEDGPEPDLDPSTATLVDAANRHPVVRRERQAHPANHAVHMRHLEAFCREARVWRLRDLRRVDVETWHDKLTREGHTKSARAHRLAYLKCAAAMLPEIGRPNPLAGIRLGPRESNAPRPEVFDWADLQAIVRAAPTEPPHIIAAIGIMAMMGLRPTEAARLRVEDFTGPTIMVGEVAAKNAHSRRQLPVAAVLQSLLARLARGRQPGHALLAPGPGYSAANHFRLLGEVNHRLAAITGRHDRTAKHLRKTFATEAIYRLHLPTALVEAHMGHSVAGTAQVTARHYLAPAHVESLRPVARRINREVRAMIVAAARAAQCAQECAQNPVKPGETRGCVPERRSA